MKDYLKSVISLVLLYWFIYFSCWVCGYKLTFQDFANIVALGLFIDYNWKRDKEEEEL